MVNKLAVVLDLVVNYDTLNLVLEQLVSAATRGLLDRNEQGALTTDSRLAADLAAGLTSRTSRRARLKAATGVRRTLRLALGAG